MPVSLLTSSVVGLGPRRPAAGAVLRRPRPAVIGDRQRPGASRGAVREGRMPFAGDRRAGAARARARLGAAVAQRPRGRRRARAADRDHARHAVVLAHRDRHARHPLGARRPAAGARARALADPALDDRAGNDRVRRRLPGQAPRLSDRRGGVRRARARADRRGALPGRRSTRCRASSAASARARARWRPSCSACFGAPIVQTTPVQAELAKIWTNILRYTNFALPNLLMMDCERYERERVRGDRPDQPRLPARRHRAAGADRRHLPAQGLRLLRGALERAGDAARRLARERVGAAVPGRGHQAPARHACATARSRCSGWRSRPTPTTSATRSRTS